jgi:predicted enzyme related to lactoylglutathione lyase
MKTIGPSFVALQVSDLETSARFYTEELGLDRAPQSPPGAVVFATTPIPFALRVPSVDLSEVEHLGWGVALWLEADNPSALHAKLAEAGVAIVTPPFEGPFGLTFAFEDPDGYIITIHG